jgi:hypothetical protein
MFSGGVQLGPKVFRMPQLFLTSSSLLPHSSRVAPGGARSAGRASRGMQPFAPTGAGRAGGDLARRGVQPACFRARGRRAPRARISLIAPLSPLLAISAHLGFANTIDSRSRAAEQGELWVTPVRHGGLSLASRRRGINRDFVRSDETARMTELGAWAAELGSADL